MSKSKPESPDEVIRYMLTIGGTNEMGIAMFDHYEMVGWVHSKARLPIKNWQAAARRWFQRNQQWNPVSAPLAQRVIDFSGQEPPKNDVEPDFDALRKALRH